VRQDVSVATATDLQPQAEDLQRRWAGRPVAICPMAPTGQSLVDAVMDWPTLELNS